MIKVHTSNYVITAAHEGAYNDDDTCKWNVVFPNKITGHLSPVAAGSYQIHTSLYVFAHHVYVAVAHAYTILKYHHI